MSENKITINDLKKTNQKLDNKEVKELDISQLVPPKKEAPKEDPWNGYHADGSPLEALDGQLERIKLEEELNQKYLKDKKDMLDQEAEIEGDIIGIESDESDENNSEDIDINKNIRIVSSSSEDDIKDAEQSQKKEKGTNSILDFDEDDFDDLDEDDEDTSEDDQKESLKDMQLQIRSKIKPVAKAFDISSFTISKRPVSMSSALNVSNTKPTVAEWVQYHAGKTVCMSEFAGYEIEKLDVGHYNTSRRQALKQVYKLIYDHITSEDKPNNFETWLRTTNYYDLQHIWFAIYMSCFTETNFIPYQCEDDKCGKVTISDHIPFENMVKYKDDKIKEKVKNILNGSCILKQDATFNVDIVPLSDRFAVALREPSLYNMLFENSILDEKFTKKYQDLLALMVFIDTIYIIDQNTQSLVPIEPKLYENNEVKTLKSKIATYSKILKTLTSDQFGQLQAYINRLDDESSGDIKYIRPEATCSKCKKVIKEMEVSPQQMLFTRHQLAALATTSPE